MKEKCCFKDYLWGKKIDDEKVFKWLPLRQHLLDTMNVSGLLWEHWLSSGQRSLVEDSLKVNGKAVSENTAKSLVMFLGAIHDLGKATPAFQLKGNKCLIEKLTYNGLIGEKDDINKLQSKNSTPHSMAGQTLLLHHGVNIGIASIVGGHHGKPMPTGTKAYSGELKAYEGNYYWDKNNNAIYEKWDGSHRGILKWALDETGFDSVEDLPEITLAVQFLLSGLLIMADWIASNEKYFPLIGIDNDEEDIKQGERLKNGWKAWFKTHTWEPMSVKRVDDIYFDRFAFKPRGVQREFARIIDECGEPSIFILEAPMGCGKTEAALIGVEQLAAKTGRSGMFLGLPTMATSNGIFLRIKNWIEKLINKNGDRASIQLIHSKASLNEDFTNIAKNIGNSEEDVIITNQWFSGRKTRILDDFVVGTIDHLLLAALKEKHLALRHLGLSKKVVVIDEVHAYDAYMSQFLYRVISWLGAYKVPVIILSATLPGHIRKELVKAYVNGSGIKMEDIKGLGKEDKNFSAEKAYPLISYLDGKIAKQIKYSENLVSKSILIKELECKCLIKKLKKSLENGGVAGVVVNTVVRAQKLARELEAEFGKAVVELLHSSFIASDRIKKEKNLLDTIGKEGKRPCKKIIIGTQVIEQSLDIDFDVLFTDLAPMDLLIQRIGRLHRHEGRERPKGLKDAICYVMGLNKNCEFEIGSSFIYGDYLLAKTQCYLPKEISLPNDISKLVQEVYGSKEENSSEYDFDKENQSIKKAHQDKINNKKCNARNFLLKNPSKKYDKSLLGLLHRDSVINSDENAVAQVRDASDRIEVIMVKKKGYGYSFIDGGEDISGKIDDFEIGKKLANQTISLPIALSKSYNIDNTIKELESYNLEELKNWQNQSWLRGTLGIILDDKNSFKLSGWKLTYSSAYGLEYKKEENDGCF